MKTHDRKKGPPELRAITRAWSMMTPEARALSRAILSFMSPGASAAKIAGLTRLREEEARNLAKSRIGGLSVS